MPLLSQQQLDLINFELTQQSLTSDFAWRSVAKTHIGNVRPTNEDAFLESTDQRLWAVADGMGGLSRGDYASKAVVTTLQGFSQLATLNENIIDLEQRLLDANETCRTAFRSKKLGSTVAALFEFKSHLFLIWAGDSRIYRLRENALTLLTQDHTVLQKKFTESNPPPENCSTNAPSKNSHTDYSGARPAAHVLTQAIGVHKKLCLELSHERLQVNDRYLLCSDGLYNSLNHEQIRNLLGHGSTEKALNRLIDSALEYGGEDNTTAVVLEATEAP